VSPLLGKTGQRGSSLPRWPEETPEMLPDASLVSPVEGCQAVRAMHERMAAHAVVAGFRVKSAIGGEQPSPRKAMRVIDA